MHKSDGKSRSGLNPAMLAVVAVAVPAAMAVEASAGVRVFPTQRTEITSVASQRTDELVRVVSEAVRQWCGSQITLSVTPCRIDFEPVTAVSVPQANEVHQGPTPLQPRLISLPPPAC
jgi:hypothetical protein